MYNGVEVLPATIKSVKEQDYKKIEYIIIDGGSKDGTLDIIKKNSNGISNWSSEPDKGIYDAMNKGLKKATGEYIWFLNAGDEIYSPATLSKILSPGQNADAYYGDVEYIDNEGNHLGKRTLKTPPETFSWKDMSRGMVVSHQSVIIKRKLAAEYDLSYRHCADVDWMIRSLKHAGVIVNTRMTLSKFLIGGYSKKNIIPSNWERLKILLKHFNIFTVTGSHIVMLFRFIRYYLTSKEKHY